MQSRKTGTTAFETETDTDTIPTPAPFGRGNGLSYGRQPTHQEIAKRAFEIYKSGKGGTPEENWYRAERELRGAA